MLEEPRYGTGWLPADERSALLERVPLRATVLDVGCWAGAAGNFLIDARSATVDGVEPDAEMAGRAAATYRRVVEGTIESALADGSLGSDGLYDAVLLMDVLEHLEDPWRVLEELRRLVRPGGAAYVSLPNVAHWSLRAQLLAGRWRYTSSGLLDRTHLRFFTPATGRELLQTSGWEPGWEGATVAHPRLARLPEGGRRLLRRWPRLFAVQMLFEARPAAGQTASG